MAPQRTGGIVNGNVVKSADHVVSDVEDHIGAYCDSPGRDALVMLVATMMVPSDNCEAASVEQVYRLIEGYLVGFAERKAAFSENEAIFRAIKVLGPQLFDQDA